MNDADRDSLIRQTHPKPQFAASFQREVWARVTIAEEQSWSAQWRRWTQNLFLSLARPAPALAVVAAMLVLGAGLGSLTAPDRSSSGQRSAYLTSINPLRAAHAAMQE